MKKCPHCFTDNHHQMRFCGGCGQNIEQVFQPVTNGNFCPACGNQNDVDAKYCSRCMTLFRSIPGHQAQQSPEVKTLTPRQITIAVIAISIGVIGMVTLAVLTEQKNMSTKQAAQIKATATPVPAPVVSLTATEKFAKGKGLLTQKVTTEAESNEALVLLQGIAKTEKEYKQAQELIAKENKRLRDENLAVQRAARRDLVTAYENKLLSKSES